MKLIRRFRDWLGRNVFFLGSGPEQVRAESERRDRAHRDTWSTEPLIAARAEVGVQDRVSPSTRPLTHNPRGER